MALVDIARAEAKTPGVKCAFGQWFDRLDPDMRTQVNELLAARDIPTSSVARVIAQASEMNFDDQKASRHRPTTSRPCADCVRAGRLS